MPDNISKHTLGLTQLQSGQGVPNHNAPKSTFYIDVTSSEFYKNTDGLNNWSLIVGGITGDYLPLSGGTVSGGTYFSNGLSASTVSATTYYNLPTDIYVTGGTYSASVSTIIFTNITGGTFEVTGITATGGGNFTGGTVTGQTIFQSGLTATTISATSLNVDYIDFNTAYSGQTLPEGRLQWDDGNGTLLLGLKGGISNMELGLENMALCFNDDTITLTAGTMVYVSGSQGNRPAIKRALATNDGYSVTTLGMVSESIASGETGFVTTYGMVNNLDTYGLTGGTALWLSPTNPGGYTDVKPQAPYHTVLIGYVVRVPNNPDQMVGSVFVNISNGWELDELHDVRISGVTEGDLLIRSTYSGSNVWVNSKTLNGDYTINGNLVVSASTGVVISGNTSSSMLRITQLGSGNAILVEDSSNPDATPFVVNSDGKIGIGTTSPNYFMEAISSGGTDAIMLFDGGTSANANLVARADTTQKVPSIVLTDRSSAYSIDTSFYIGLDRTSGASPNLYVNRNDAIYVNNYQDKGHYFITNNAGSKDVRMLISSNGNVGIGVTSATTKLQVSGDVTFNQSKLTIEQKNDIVGIDIFNPDESMYQLSNGDGDWCIVGKTPSEFYFYNNPNIPIKFYTDASEKMTILGNGNVGIGTTNPSSKLYVSGDTFINGSLSANTFYGSGTGLINIPISGVTDLSTELYNKFDKTGGTVNGSVIVTGDVTILGTATTINTQTLSIEDNVITLNSNYSAGTPFFGHSGVEVLRGSGTTAAMLWEEQNSQWEAGLHGSTKKVILSGDSLSYLLSGHTHPISEITNLQTNLNDKLSKSTGGTVVANTYFTNGLTASTTSADETVIPFASVAIYDNEPPTGTGIGGFFDASLGNAVSKYSLQLKDGTEGVNKVLISKTTDGKANWSSTLSGLTGVYANTISAATVTSSGGITSTSVSAITISANTAYVVSATTGTSVANLAIQSDGKIIKAGGNAIVENYYYSVSNTVDTTFYEDDKVILKWDETGNNLKFTMKVAPGGSGDMRSLGVLMGSTTTFNVAITTINFEYHLYSAGISAGNRMQAFVTAENDVTYPAYHITAYNTGESYHNTIWVQKIIKI